MLGVKVNVRSQNRGCCVPLDTAALMPAGDHNRCNKHYAEMLAADGKQKACGDTRCFFLASVWMLKEGRKVLAGVNREERL